MRPVDTSRWSLYSLFFCMAMIWFTSFVYYPKWEQQHTEATISWDVSGYYLYLPAAFIYQDIRQLAFFPEIEQKYHPGPGMGQAFKHEGSGNYVMKYAAGQALQFLPWFTVAHLVAEPLGYPADGFSKPYQTAIGWGSLLVALLGLWMLRRILLRYFSDRTVALTLLALVAGTNYLNYAAIDGAMTHNWLFTLYTLLIAATIRFYERPSGSMALCIGLLCGWATITRPTEIISVLIPLFWATGDIRARFYFFRQHFLKLLWAVLGFAALVFIQLGYWKWATGEWLVYSYQDQGFNWVKPHFINVLFSFRAGWLVYSPMLLFAVAGWYFFKKQHPTLFGPLLAFAMLFLYITAAWNIWWYGGSLGARAMVQSYPVWMFPLGAFIAWVLEKRNRQYLFGAVALFFCWHNLYWTHQAHRGGLYVTEQMTKHYFLKIYGKFSAEPDWVKLLDNKDEFRIKNLEKVQVIQKIDFENDSLQIDSAQALEGKRSKFLDKNNPFTPRYDLPIQPLENGRWLRVRFDFQCLPKEQEYWKMTQLIVRFEKGEQRVKERIIRLQRLVKSEERSSAYMDIQIPDSSFDKAYFYFWNAESDHRVLLDNIAVEQIKD